MSKSKTTISVTESKIVAAVYDRGSIERDAHRAPLQSFPLEILDCFFVLLGSSFCIERAQVPAFASFWIFLA
jgi:hypothetical protein